MNEIGCITSNYDKMLQEQVEQYKVVLKLIVRF